jgi:hypothetical protein
MVILRRIVIADVLLLSQLNPESLSERLSVSRWMPGELHQAGTVPIVSRNSAAFLDCLVKVTRNQELWDAARELD